MKVKAVIMRPDRTNDVVIVKKKNIQGKTFKHGDTTYFLHPDRFQVTWVRAMGGMGWRKYFATYYYVSGMANALPVPNFQMVNEPVLDEAGKPQFDAETGKPKTKQIFPKIIDNGIQGEELAAIFNPWFYRIIASVGKDAWAQIQFYMIVGALLLSAYNAWTLSQAPSLEEIQEAIAAAHNSGVPPAAPSGGTQFP
jgi:hypothetical protein